MQHSISLYFRKLLIPFGFPAHHLTVHIKLKDETEKFRFAQTTARAQHKGNRNNGPTAIVPHNLHPHNCEIQRNFRKVYSYCLSINFASYRCCCCCSHCVFAFVCVCVRGVPMIGFILYIILWH